LFIAFYLPPLRDTFGWESLIGPEKPGLAMVLVGILLVVSGTVMYLFEPPQAIPNTLCIGKSPIYCYKTLHGILFDTGCLLILGGIIILLLNNIMKLRKTKANSWRQKSLICTANRNELEVRDVAGLLAGLGIRAEMTKSKMKELGAVSEETAKTPEELGVDEWFLNLGISQIHGIKRTKDGRYYVKSNEG
jgi:hypothetical protein